MKFEDVKEFIKTIFSNKRYRAIAILFLYFLFFIFVYFVINGIKDNNDYIKPPITALDKYNELTKYQVKYEITYNNKTVIFMGNYDNNIENIIINNREYQLKDNKLFYQDKELINKYKYLAYFQNKHIYNLIKASDKITTTDNIVDDTKETTYKLKKEKYIEYVNPNIQITNDVIISIIEKNNEIIKIEVGIDIYNVVIIYSL